MYHIRVIQVIALVFTGVCTADIPNDQNFDFGARLAHIGIQLIKASHGSKNVIISPTSIYSILEVLHLGAGGNTAAEIKSLLGSGSSSSGDIHNKVKYIQDEQGESIFSSQTQIFYKKGVEIDRRFQRKLIRIFNFGLTEIDSSKPRYSNAVNDWLSNVMNMTINEEDQDFYGENDVQVINTISFQQYWNDPFHRMDSTDGDFQMNTVNSVSLKFMMKRDVRLVSGKNEVLGAKWIHLLYKPNDIFNNMKMVLILPLKRFGLSELISKISEKDFYEIVKGNETNRISIVIPQFDVEARYSVKSGLQKLGVREIFTNHANLTGIRKSGGPAKLDKIIVTTHIRVDEGKTSAKSKTVGSLDFHSGSLNFPCDAFFTADEPFLFFILAGEIPLFVGVIAQPKQLSN